MPLFRSDAKISDLGGQHCPPPDVFRFRASPRGAVVRGSPNCGRSPLRLAQAELEAGRWRALDAPGFAWQRPVRVYTRAGEPQSAPLARFLQALRNAAAPLDRDSTRGDLPQDRLSYTYTIKAI